MHVYVQKSTTTTFPASPSGVSGDELIQPVAPSSDEKHPPFESLGVRPPCEPIHSPMGHDPSFRVDVHDRVPERLRSFLWQVVPDPAPDRSVLVLAGEL